MELGASVVDSIPEPEAQGPAQHYRVFVAKGVGNPNPCSMILKPYLRSRVEAPFRIQSQVQFASCERRATCSPLKRGSSVVQLV